MKSTAILIPARYQSERFPGKPLTMLGGVPMIQRVYTECAKSGLDTFVVTDHPAVAEVFDYKNVLYTSDQLRNGTERCAEAAKRLDYDMIINVQGDMPDVTIEMINTIRRILNMGYSLATLFTDMSPELQNDPNTVKLVSNSSGRALWFGRGMTGYGLHHLGIYGYQSDVLKKYPLLDVFAEEEIEKLEQLRWLRNSYNMQLGKVDFTGIEINTPDDAEKWNARWKSMGNN